MSVYYFITLPSKIYVFEVVDNNKRPSASCSAHTGVAGRGAARHNFPSHGARRDPPEPDNSNIFSCLLFSTQFL